VHALFRVDDPLPVAPGRSPFRTRGLYYDRLIARLKADVGAEKLLGAIDDADVRAFAEQKFSWTAWYDAFPAKPICAAAARSTGRDFEDAIRDRTRAGALAVIPSAFRLAFRIPGPAAITQHVAQITAHMMDFVQVEIEEARENFTSGWGRGVPLYIAPHTANTTIGFFAAMLELRGGVGVQGSYTDVIKDGARHGYETVSIRYQFKWTS
jgi:hypothetical protein